MPLWLLPILSSASNIGKAWIRNNQIKDEREKMEQIAKNLEKQSKEIQTKGIVTQQNMNTSAYNNVLNALLATNNPQAVNVARGTYNQQIGQSGAMRTQTDRQAGALLSEAEKVRLNTPEELNGWNMLLGGASEVGNQFMNYFLMDSLGLFK